LSPSAKYCFTNSKPMPRLAPVTTTVAIQTPYL
jgi:hypothetical protein